MSTKTDIIDKAKQLITGERNADYGSFADNITVLCQIMGAMTGREYTREEGRCFFIALKLCRCHKGKFTPDTLVDLIGYAQLVQNDIDECAPEPVADCDNKFESPPPEGSGWRPVFPDPPASGFIDLIERDGHRVYNVPALGVDFSTVDFWRPHVPSEDGN